MKVLSFGVLYFKLPDDFEGGLSDALRAFADYHDQMIGTPQQKIGASQDPPADRTASEHESKVWYEFWDLVQDGDTRVYGTAGLSQYPGKAHLDLNTGEPT